MWVASSAMAGIKGSNFSHWASVKSDGYAFRVLGMRFSLSLLLGFFNTPLSSFSAHFQKQTHSEASYLEKAEGLRDFTITFDGQNIKSASEKAVKFFAGRIRYLGPLRTD